MSTMSRLLAFVLLTCSPLAAFAAAPPPVEVTTCGQAIPRRAVGYLTADLDCTGYDGVPAAILVSRNATLELRGHRVTGGLLTVACAELRPDRFGVIRLQDSSRCTVVGGGGVVSGAEAHGVFATELTISDVTIENSGQEGIYTRKKARVTNVIVTGSGGHGMRLDGPSIVRGSTVTNSGENGIVCLRKLRIYDSSVTGSGTSAACEYPWSCVDIASALRPEFVNTVCDHSRGPSQTDWDVCALD